MMFDKRITPMRPDLAAAHLRGIVDAPRFAEPKAMQVCVGATALRRTPSPDGAVDTEALFGETVQVYEIDEDGWAWGQLATDGYVGWLAASALAQTVSVPTHRVAVQRTLLYPGPSIKLPPMQFLHRGAPLTVTSIEGDFARLAGAGFVFAKHIAAHDARVADYVAVAEDYLHVPYLWGGRTGCGLDCSGLAQLSLATAGIAAPRDSDMQEKALGDPVAIGEDLAGLRRGDLVFWKGHVGIMQDGERLLHATGHFMLVVSEPLREACERIVAKGAGPITAVKRLALQ